MLGINFVSYTACVLKTFSSKNAMSYQDTDTVNSLKVFQRLLLMPFLGAIVPYIY